MQPTHILLLVGFFIITSCSPKINQRIALTESIRIGSSMDKKEIEAPPFILTSFERVAKNSDVANVYIEGDGLAWLGKRTVSSDPTPVDPIALKLAAQDRSNAVFYIARPCQYITHSKGICEKKYWTSHRFAPEVITSFNHALDDIKYRHGVHSFNLIGFSGGAAIAVLVAATRNDISSIRTVAGNLDTDGFSKLNKVSVLHGSLNPLTVAHKIQHIPQWHFVGNDDRVIPSVLVDNFLSASGKTGCTHITHVAASHEQGWEQQWKELLKNTPACN